MGEEQTKSGSWVKVGDIEVSSPAPLPEILGIIDYIIKKHKSYLKFYESVKKALPGGGLI